MDPILKQQITQELTDFLRRPPTENEIINAQTDPIIMGKIKFKELSTVSDKVSKLKL